MKSDLLDSEPISRKEQVLFYIVDASRSMRGNKIRTVNRIMRETIPEIRGIGGSDTELKIAVMRFSNGCEWMYDSPVSVEEFVWHDIEPGGWTNLGAACRELNSKLSRQEFMRSPHLSYAPVIFLLSDGGPTDDYQKAVYELGSNKWFKHSLKIAVAIGQKAQKEKLSIFTGDPEAVISTNNSHALAALIKQATITSSMINSAEHSMTEDDSKQKLLNEKLHEIVSSVNNYIEDGWDV